MQYLKRLGRLCFHFTFDRLDIAMTGIFGPYGTYLRKKHGWKKKGRREGETEEREIKG